MTPKERAIKKLKKEYKNEAWGEVDRYDMDFHKFIIEKLVPHLSIKGIKLLTSEYERWNKQGQDDIDRRKIYR